MAADLKTFVDQVFSINSTVSTVYGSSLAVGSRATPSDGGPTPSSDLIYKLRRETASFAEMAASADKDNDALTIQAKTIEGLLLNLQVLGQISSTFCDA